MIRINPIYAKDGDRLYREFFEQQFRTHRLGAPGNWHGGAAQKLRLTEPVQVGVFSSLLRGLTPEGEALVGRQPQRADRAAAWRITLTDAGPASVVLWALSPSVYRLRIRRAHTHAVRAVITDFESGLNGRPWFDNPDAPGRKSALFAEFQAGATRQQAPRLHTNLFLFNLLFQKGAKTRTFAPEEVKQQWLRMNAVYTRTLGKELSRILGHQVQIPAELSVRFDAHPLNGLPDPDRRVAPQALENRELFAAWQQQARGWGDRQVPFVSELVELESGLQEAGSVVGGLAQDTDAFPAAGLAGNAAWCRTRHQQTDPTAKSQSQPRNVPLSRVADRSRRLP